MKEFSKWRDNHDDESINESAADAIRARLDSSNYLKHAFAGTPYEEQIKKNIQENKQAETQQSNLENITKGIAEIEKKISEQLIKEKEEIDEQLTSTNNSEEAPVMEEELAEVDTDVYKLYRDREESFECNISIEGAALSSAQARLIIDTNLINLVFYGKLYKDGRCLVPLKKMTMFPEGTRGQIRLEVVVDDTLFSPWESACIVEGAKKVSVDIKQKKGVSIKFETNND